jgi:hypothetical protein
VIIYENAIVQVMPRRARGRGKGAKHIKLPNLDNLPEKRGVFAKGALNMPNKEKMVEDLRKVRKEADKLGEGPWSLGGAMDKAVRSALRHAGDDIRMLVGIGHVHQHRKGSGNGAGTVKSAKDLNGPGGVVGGMGPGGMGAPPKMEDAADAKEAKLRDLNALTADVDQVTNSDDMADMRRVDAKLHQLVKNMRQRIAART